MIRVLIIHGLIIVMSCWSSCTTKQDQLYTLVTESGITFNNELAYTNELNPYTYRNYYNGAGVGIGDFNNDGLDDIYFAGNQVDNQLYQNLGQLKFKNVTSDLLTCHGSWSTGVSVVDINNDGWLDIYVCKSGPPNGPRRTNELFINKGNWIFEEQAASYGLDIKGFSVHASFFDFDRDGDLDCYLLNNSIRSVGGYDLREGLRDISSETGNMMLVNEESVYVNRSNELGIYTSDIGFGLGVNTSDINGDGWKDIYVGNDFFERDYLYLNQAGRGFDEVGADYIASHSLGSMGVDVADINEDGHKDIFVAEMAPSTLARKKTKATYESWDKYTRAEQSGYHRQLGRNMLQLNTGEQFIDISRAKGVGSTEWSWAPLIFDMNNDGLKDIFISNGVGKDLLDRDYLAYMANEQSVGDLVSQRNEESLKKLIDIMPEGKTMNAFFKQNENFTFQNVSSIQTNTPPSYSNGAALSDLDLDGDVDMVISNINDGAFVLQNNSQNNYMTVHLSDKVDQHSTIGTELIVYADDMIQHVENNPFRGFQSTNSQKVTIGLGQHLTIDSIKVIWPDGTVQVDRSIDINRENVIEKNNAGINVTSGNDLSRKVELTELDRIDYNYPVRVFNEFNKEKLLTYMTPSIGPVLAFVNQGKSSVITGGSQNHPLKIVTNSDHQMPMVDSSFFNQSFRPHVTALHTFDSDGDGDLDIYAAHGSRVFSQYSSELDDLLYENKGDGVYQLVKGALPFSHKMVTSCVASADLNGDGLEDLIVGEGLNDEVYGTSTSLIYFENLGKNQYKKSAVLSDPSVAMIRDVEIMDLNQDGTNEIVVAGEWMAIRTYNLSQNKFELIDNIGEMSEKSGLWRDLKIVDIDRDGDLDIIGGNQGLNSYLNVRSRLYINDFDDNGKAEQIGTIVIDGKDYPILDYDEITAQIPLVRSVARSYAEYAEMSMSDLFEKNILESTVIREVTELRSGIFINNKGMFEFIPFPDEIQYTSTHAVAVDDINDDGIQDILIGGNHYRYKPQFGQDDASTGSLILGSMTGAVYGFDTVELLNIRGEIRLIEKCGHHEYWIGVNQQDLIKYRLDYED